MPFLFFCIGQIFVGTKFLLSLCDIDICLVLFCSNRRHVVILVLLKLYLLLQKNFNRNILFFTAINNKFCSSAFAVPKGQY